MKVIAEIGSNWRSLNDCHASITKAKECGADFVKFQLFTPNSLYGPHEKFDISQLGQSPYLHNHWLPHLAAQAKGLGIEFMCSAFSPRDYEIVNEVVSYHKIASAELTDTQILKSVNTFKKPVFLSTGGSTLEEIKQALEYLKDCDVTVMYCVADYPAKVIDFNYFKLMQFTLGDDYDYGYSDHSLDLLNVPVLSRDKGASVIEKHVNLCSAVNTDDAAHSINSNEFKLLIDNLKTRVTTDETFNLNSQSMRSMWRRRFIATENLVPGERLRLNNNIGIYRAKKTAPDPVLTFRPWDVEGRKVRGHMKIGDVICYHNLEDE